MKIKNITNVTTSSLLAISLTLGACGKNTTTHEIIMLQGENGKQSQLQVNAQMGHEAWSKLILSNQKNIALAEILSATVSRDNQAMIQSLVSNLSNEDVEEIISQVKSEREALRKSFLFRQNTQVEGTDIYKKSIIEGDYGAVDSETNAMTIATFSYLKSKSLDEIYRSFNTTIEENSKVVAQTMIRNIAETNTSLAEEIESIVRTTNNVEDFQNKIKKSRAYLEKADEFFKFSGLNTKEQLVVVATGAVGAVIYSEVKSSGSFIKVMNKYKEMKLVIRDVKESIELIKMTASIIKQDRDQMKKSFDEMNAGLKGVRDGIEESVDRIKNSPDVNTRKSAQFIYDRVILGKKLNVSEANATIVESHKKISENITKSFTAASNMANSLEAIVNATNLLSTKLGVKLPPHMQKALATASQVAAGVKLASSIITGCMSGGVLSAVSMLSSGPIGSMLGVGGGTDPEVMATLGKIEAKLDLVLENQQKMIDLQVETIKMIKNLAIMVDEYHQKEMIAIAGLHDDNMINMELAKAKLNSNIRHCESLIDLELKKFWGSDKRNSFSGSITADIDYDKFYSNFKTLNDFKKFARGATANDYSYCQDALSEAFGNTSANGNPILSMYNSEDGQNLFSFQRDTYKPLVSFLTHFSKSNGESKKILHIPMARITDLDLKNDRLSNESTDSLSTRTVFDYNFENLLSTKSLERYFSSYAILYPIFEFDKNDWNKTLPELVDTYYSNISEADGVTIERENTDSASRSYFFMNNALDLIQSAIAQEALLAGESIIPAIRKELKNLVLTNDSCGDRVVCAIRSNKLLMKNYLAYTIQKNIGFVNTMEEYKRQVESENPNLEIMSDFLGIKGRSAGVLAIENGKVVVKLKELNDRVTTIELPSADQVKNDQVIYSENMPRLLKMQKDAISAMVKLSPSQFRSVENRVGLANLLLVKEF